MALATVTRKEVNNMMRYSEFLKSTDCKDNKHNRNIFFKLVDLYMNSDITKEDVYEFGKKLVDNSESE